MNYQKIYDQIIERARKEGRKKGEGVYYEAHHIVPKCLGGEGNATQWRTHSNITLLTAKEHYLCHLLLSSAYKDTIYEAKMNYAIYMMSRVRTKHQNRYTPSARAFEKIKLLRSKAIKETIQGRVYTEDHRRKIAEGKKGSKNPRYGKKANNSKSVLDPASGRRFTTCKEAADYFKVSPGTITYRLLKGELKA